ncbi:MAG: hypothetical protein AB1298_00460 [Bacteroidota bacterium]
MNTKKILLGGIAGTVAYFLLNWLVYGILIADFMAKYSNPSVMRSQEEMMNYIWAMVISNCASGFLIAFILGWSNKMNAMEGAKIAGIVGLLFALAVDFAFYALSTLYLSVIGIVGDVIAWTIMSAIVGAMIGWVMGRGNKKE